MGLFDLLGKKSEKEIKNIFSDMEKKIKDAVKDGFKEVKNLFGIDIKVRRRYNEEKSAALNNDALPSRSDSI